MFCAHQTFILLKWPYLFKHILLANIYNMIDMNLYEVLSSIIQT